MPTLDQGLSSYSSNSTICARLSAAFFLMKKPHLIAALIFSQLTTALPEREQSSSKGWGECMYDGNPKPSSGTLIAAWPPILKSWSKCCISSFSSISWLRTRISSSVKNSISPFSLLLDQSSKGFKLDDWIRLLNWNPVDCGGPRPMTTSLSFLELCAGLLPNWTCWSYEVPHWERQLVVMIWDCVEYLLVLSSLYPVRESCQSEVRKISIAERTKDENQQFSLKET